MKKHYRFMVNINKLGVLILLINLLITSCSIYNKEKVAGMYISEMNESKDRLFDKELILELPDSFYFESSGSVRYYSSGKWEINGKEIILNSNYQINNKFVKVKEKTNPLNTNDSLLTIQIGYDNNQHLTFITNISVIINDDNGIRKFHVKPSGKITCKTNNLKKIDILFIKENKIFNYIPIDTKSNIYNFTVNFENYNSYQIFEDAIFIIRKNKIVEKNTHIQYKKQK